MRSQCLTGLLIAGVLAGCDPLTPAERRTIDEWLQCEECSDGELDSVAQLGNRGVRRLTAALRGAPPEDSSNIRFQAESMHARVQGATIPVTEYADRAVANYKATYQKRAAIGLHRINTPQAHAALVAALHDYARYRADVLRVLGAAAGAQLSKLEGDSQVVLVDSFVPVDPRVLVSDSTQQAEGMPGIRVVFQVDSGGGQLSDSVRFTDTQGQASVRWRLGPTPGQNQLRASAAGREVIFQADAQ